MSKIFNRAVKIGGETYKVGASSTSVTVLELDVDNMITNAKGSTVPTDGDAGYAKGCIFIDTDGVAGNVIYVNDGTSSSCDFNVGTAGPITQNDIVAVSTVTATTDGLTTGIIPATAFHVTVTSDSADKIVTLPASVVGKTILFYIGATGCELRTTAGSSIKINNVISGSTNEAAIPATSLCTCTCISSTEWILTAVDELGAVITAIVPNAI